MKIDKGLFISINILVIFSLFTGALALFGNNITEVTKWDKKEIVKIENRLRRLDKESITIPLMEFDSNYDFTITVRNKEDFDNLTVLIPQKLQDYKNILVEIEEGTYFSTTDHILINNQIHPDCGLSITGNGDVTIMATSHNLMEEAKIYDGYAITDVLIGDTVNPNEVFTDGENLIHLSVIDDSINSGIKFVDRLFEKIKPNDRKDCYYKLKCDILPDKSADECKNLWLWATHSWISSYEKIDSIVDGYIYLTANSDVELYQCPLNTDYTSWKIMPRIKIVNHGPSNNGVYVDKNGLAYLPKKHASIFKCDKGAFLNIENSELKCIEVAGIKFVGGNAPVIDINRVTDYVYIHDCDFTSQQDLSIRLGTDNGIVRNNAFRNSMGTVIDIPNKGCRNHVISNNRFTNCGNRLLNQGCIKAAADSVLISGNVFHNNLISALNVGVWHGAKPQGRISSIVEDNFIYNDDEFLKDYIGKSLLDVSMLYVYTKNDNVIIRRNRLHGFRTLASGNGIYIDDGAYNVSVYDNIITDIDGKLYNINCRANITEKAKENAPAYSTNNFIANNIVDGSIRFEIRGDDKACNYPKSSYGGSIFLLKGVGSIKNKIENASLSMDKKYLIDSIDLYLNLKPQDYDSIVSNQRPIFIDYFNKWVHF